MIHCLAQVMKEKSFFERQIVKDAMALLRLSANLHDDATFERTLPRPPKLFGELAACFAHCTSVPDWSFSSSWQELKRELANAPAE